MKQKQTSIILGTHGEDYGSWMSTPVFYIVGGIMLLAVLLTILSFFVFHIAILGVLFSLITVALSAMLPPHSKNGAEAFNKSEHGGFRSFKDVEDDSFIYRVK